MALLGNETIEPNQPRQIAQRTSNGNLHVELAIHQCQRARSSDARAWIELRDGLAWMIEVAWDAPISDRI